MRMNVTDFKNWEMNGLDGRIGVVKDVLVDDDNWSVRYLVVALDGRFSDRKILVAPTFITEADSFFQEFSTSLSKETVANCPRLEWVQPVSLQYKEALRSFLGPIAYGIGSLLLTPQLMLKLMPGHVTTFVDESKPASLRSLMEMLRYKVIDGGGETARLAEVSVNLKSWIAEHLTAKLTVGRQNYEKTLPMNRIKSVEWGGRMMRLNRTVELKPNLAPSLEQAWSNMSMTESAVF